MGDTLGCIPSVLILYSFCNLSLSSFMLASVGTLLMQSHGRVSLMSSMCMDANGPKISGG